MRLRRSKTSGRVCTRQASKFGHTPHWSCLHTCHFTLYLYIMCSALGSGRGYALALQLMYKVGKVGGAGRGVLSVESCAVRLNQTSARVTRRAANSIKI